MSAQDCVDTNFDADGVEITDGMDGCADYAAGWCGGYDTDTFDSMSMCCVCGGGETAEAPVSECSDTELTVTLSDSYGDGGGSVTIGDAVLTNGGDSSSMTVCVDLTVCTDVTYASTDSWSSENSWSVSDSDGNVLV